MINFDFSLRSDNTMNETIPKAQFFFTNMQAWNSSQLNSISLDELEMEILINLTMVLGDFVMVVFICQGFKLTVKLKPVEEVIQLMLNKISTDWEEVEWGIKPPLVFAYLLCICKCM